MDLHKEMGELIGKYIETIDKDQKEHPKAAATVVITEALLLGAVFAVGTGVSLVAFVQAAAMMYDTSAQTVVEQASNAPSTKTAQ